MKGRLPDFLIIGAMKAGTTSLHDYLGRHPDIYMSHPKEVHYFTDNVFFKKDLDWYKSHFITEKLLAGTSPQNYTKLHWGISGKVPKRLFEHIPDVKLIYVVRDPVERIESHYRENQAAGHAPEEGLNRYLSDLWDNHFVLTSMYYFQISKYLEYFPKEQILILTAEELLSNRLETLNKVFRFLSVREMGNAELFDYKKNTKNSKKKRTGFSKVLYNSSTSFIRNLVPAGIKRVIRESKAYNTMIYKPVSSEKIEPEVRERLIRFLKDDIRKLEDFSGKDLSEWYRRYE